jgi:hypothetical protein
MDVGEGMLWRSKVDATPFKTYIADPVTGGVALQGRVKIQGRDKRRARFELTLRFAL